MKRIVSVLAFVCTGLTTADAFAGVLYRCEQTDGAIVFVNDERDVARYRKAGYRCRPVYRPSYLRHSNDHQKQEPSGTESPSRHTDRGTKLADAAVELYRMERYEEAADLFENAYKSRKDPLFLWNMGRAAEEGGLLEKAREAFKRYVEAETDADARSEGVAKVDSINKRLPGRIDIRCSTRGAEVEILSEGHVRLPLDAPVEVEPGEHTLIFRADGYFPLSKRIVVAGGATETVVVELEASPALGGYVSTGAQPGRRRVVDLGPAPPIASAPLPPPAVELPRTTPALPGDGMRPTGGGPTARAVWGWSLLGSGIAMSGICTGLHFKFRAEAQTAIDRDDRGSYDGVRKQVLTNYIVLGVGAWAAVLGVYLLSTNTTPDGSGRSSGGTSFFPAGVVTSDYVGGAVSGSF